MRYSMKYLNGIEKLGFLIAIISVIAQCWLELKIPEYTAELTNQVTSQFQGKSVSLESVLVPGGLMLACAVGSLAIAFISSYLIAYIGSMISMRMRSAVFRKAMSFSLQEMSHFESSSLISRCTNNIEIVLRYWINGPLYFVKAVFTLGIAIFKMTRVDIRWMFTMGTSTIIALLFVVIVILITFIVVSKQQAYYDTLNRLVGEHMSGVRIVHAFNAYRNQTKTFDENNKGMTRYSIYGNYTQSFLLPGLFTITYLLTIAIYITGLGLISSAPVAERATGYADMVEFTSYVSLIIKAVVFLIRGLGQIPGIHIANMRIREILELPMVITDGDGVDLGKSSHGSLRSKNAGFSKSAALDQDDENTVPAIEFRNVSFKYPAASGDKGTDVLRDVSFKVNRGETAAIIGDTGCGKTTILNLIPRLYEAGSGSIYINGADIRKYKLKDLRNMLGYVPQKTMLFTRSIAGNIDFGDDGGFAKTLNDIQEAASVGQADEFIRQKPEGYETKVLSGGANFSGGQRQRLTISRAVCRDPEIYLFDDSFSALDFKTDRELRRALRQHAAGATVVIVAQRVSTIRNADRIFVMEKGQIVGQGTHDELMRSCGVYQEIAASQDAAS